MHIYLNEKTQIVGYASFLKKPTKKVKKTRKVKKLVDKKEIEVDESYDAILEIDHVDTDTFKTVDTVPQGFEKNFSEYTYKDGTLIHTGVTDDGKELHLKKKKKELSQKRDEALSNITVSDIRLDGHSLVNFDMVIESADRRDENVNWIDVNNKKVSFTVAEAYSILDEAINQRGLIYTSIRDEKDELNG